MTSASLSPADPRLVGDCCAYGCRYHAAKITNCSASGGSGLNAYLACRIRITETLEVIPRQWKVIQSAQGVLVPAARGHQPAAGAS